MLSSLAKWFIQILNGLSAVVLNYMDWFGDLIYINHIIIMAINGLS